jgi:hypothetical protein
MRARLSLSISEEKPALQDVNSKRTILSATRKKWSKNVITLENQ